MTLQDLIEKGSIIAKEIGDILSVALNKLYEKEPKVIALYVLIFVLAVLLIIGIRLLNDEIEEYRCSRENKSEKLPWYLRDSSIFLALAVLILMAFAVILVLIL